jgi:hypothetical protein
MHCTSAGSLSKMEEISCCCSKLHPGREGHCCAARFLPTYAGLCIWKSSSDDKASVVHNRLHVLFLYCYSPCQGTAEYLVCAESHDSNKYSGLRDSELQVNHNKFGTS